MGSLRNVYNATGEVSLFMTFPAMHVMDGENPNVINAVELDV